MAIKSSPFLKTPECNAKIWRYLDLAKFIDLLNKKCLYFCNTKNFGDPFEGTLPEFNKIDENRNKAYRYLNDKVPEDVLPHFKARTSDKTYKRWQNRVLVNCWHISETESVAMWEIYAERVLGLAIQSTAQRLKDSLNLSKEDIIIGEVKYLNYNSEWMDEKPWNVFFTKKKPYEYEREVRAAFVIYDDDLHDEEQFDKVYLNEHNIDLSKIRKAKVGKSIYSDNEIHPYLPGKYIQVDIRELIERVYVSPYASEYFIDVVKTTLEKYGISSSSLALSELFYAKNN